MTNDEITELAKQAGFKFRSDEEGAGVWFTDTAGRRWFMPIHPHLTKFAELIQARAVPDGYVERINELEELCAEMYQVVGVLLSDCGRFEDEDGQKVLDNLCEAKRIHDNLLPFASKEIMEIDSNVEAVRQKLLNRSQVGIAKYGTTTEREDLDLVAWLHHLQEELMDAAVYIEAAIAKAIGKEGK